MNLSSFRNNFFIKKNWENLLISPWKVKIKGVLIGALFIIAFSATFIHINYTELKKWEPYALHYKEYKEIIKKANSERLLLTEELRANGLDVYAERLVEIDQLKAKDLKFFHEKRKTLKKEYSILGYESERLFLYEFGRSVFALMSCVLLIILIFNTSLIKKMKTFLIIGSLGFLYVSFFWLIHTLFIKTDYPKWAYNLSFVIAAIISSGIVFALVYFFNKIELKKKQRMEDTKNMVKSGFDLINLLKAKN